MDNEILVQILIWGLSLFGCALTFLGIGIWAEKSDKPMHFWSGSTVDPKKIRDLQAYNHANAVMWKWYSVPYFLSGVLGCLDHWYPGCMILGVCLLVLACLPGIGILIYCYSRIEKKYILP